MKPTMGRFFGFYVRQYGDKMPTCFAVRLTKVHPNGCWTATGRGGRSKFEWSAWEQHFESECSPTRHEAWSRWLAGMSGRFRNARLWCRIERLARKAARAGKGQ